MIAVSLNTNIYVCLFFNTRFLLFKVSLNRYRNTIHLCLCIMFLANLLVLVIMLSYSNACSICWMLAEFFFIISVFVFICWCILSHAKKVMRHNQRQTYTLLAILQVCDERALVLSLFFIRYSNAFFIACVKKWDSLKWTSYKLCP